MAKEQGLALHIGIRFDGTTVGNAPAGPAILLEDVAGYILLETGDFILLEN